VCGTVNLKGYVYASSAKRDLEKHFLSHYKRTLLTFGFMIYNVKRACNIIIQISVYLEHLKTDFT